MRLWRRLNSNKKISLLEMNLAVRDLQLMIRQ